MFQRRDFKVFEDYELRKLLSGFDKVPDVVFI